jgi:hypothetical protein
MPPDQHEGLHCLVPKHILTMAAIGPKRDAHANQRERLLLAISGLEEIFSVVR